MTRTPYENYAMIRDKLGLTDYRVAKETGIGTATMSSWKNGRYVPKTDKLQQIADYLHVSLDYLLTGKEENSNELLDRDIKRKFNEISDLLRSGEMAPLYFDGKQADEESIELLLKQVEFSLALIESEKGKK